MTTMNKVKYCLLEHAICPDDGPSLKFTGVEIGFASKWTDYVNEFSNKKGTELRLYKTRGGKYICIRTEYKKGIEDCYCFSTIAKNHKEVIGFFGHGCPARDLYISADIKDEIHID